MTQGALSIDGLSVHFGGLQALRGVSAEITPGSVHGLLGPNGSGKTTLLNAVCGFVRSTGRVCLDGVSLTRAPAYVRARSGLLRTFQSPKLVPDLTVEELLRVGEHPRGFRPWWLVTALPLRDSRARKSGQQRALATLDLLGLDGSLLAVPIRDLSQGVLKMVDIARALMADPKVLLLDEPSSGMSEAEIARLRGHILELARRGTTLLLVEHNLPLVRAVCDRVTVLNLGEQLTSGPTADVLTRPEVVEAFLGVGADGSVPNAVQEQPGGGP
ncbi:branched-chain amino acid transport system ATP-binding protein [Antricoccus suffuscus]|uniref:Branched-chain amino acid transport system ATP-binding protein n=1 Tax=Antricoccus suffuscus TaxID=1629062 RepID=A0A2T1A6Z2_9ACTN|nr:ATP-binding cassette domain-containing protein [Antricoccus suffuscus]PRZ44324.1 branched-chain amino acid transport system ATP-binding protein [Antricoccus suffuscus]